MDHIMRLFSEQGVLAITYHINYVKLGNKTSDGFAKEAPQVIRLLDKKPQKGCSPVEL
jgi:hypothetical protein